MATSGVAQDRALKTQSTRASFLLQKWTFHAARTELTGKGRRPSCLTGCVLKALKSQRATRISTAESFKILKKLRTQPHNEAKWDFRVTVHPAVRFTRLLKETANCLRVYLGMALQ